MLAKEFMDKWQGAVNPAWHPDHSSDPHVLFWTLSYDLTAPHMGELVGDYLSLPDHDTDGMVYDRVVMCQQAAQAPQPPEPVERAATAADSLAATALADYWRGHPQQLGKRAGE